MPKLIPSRLLLTSCFLMGSISAVAQSVASPGAWSGWARCEIKASGQDYSDQQTHTWIIGSGNSNLSGAFRIYPATWSVVGGGSLEHSQGTQTLKAQWATTAQNVSAPLAVFVRASDGKMFIQARHSQLRAPGAVQGYQQLSVDGKPQMPGKISAEAFEWSFPVIEVSRPKPNDNLVANGSSTPPVNGKVGLMQPAATQATASCTWHFTQGAAPALPPSITPQAVPTPAAVGTTASSGQTSNGTGTCISAPRNLVLTSTGATVQLSWAAPISGAPLSYILEASSQAGGPADLANANTGTNDPSLVVPNVPPGTYYIRVRAVASCGTSAVSNEVQLVVQ